MPDFGADYLYLEAEDEHLLKEELHGYGTKVKWEVSVGKGCVGRQAARHAQLYTQGFVFLS